MIIWNAVVAKVRVCPKKNFEDANTAKLRMNYKFIHGRIIDFWGRPEGKNQMQF